MPRKMFIDNPINSVADDQFGFTPYAEFLRDTIIETQDLPFCIGIFGPWGSGKSSFMKLLQDSLTGQSDIRTIWFNPWKYDKKEDLWNALIQSLLNEMNKSIVDPEVKSKIKKLALSSSWLALKKGLVALSHGLVTEDALQGLMDAVSKQDELYYQHINHFEEDFAKVVELYTQRGKLVIFIDDLDRCLPENAITVLESLKLFLSNSCSVFVLGMDHHIVEEGIKHRFQDKITLSGRDYLDKIVQIPFYLPPVRFEKLKASLMQGESLKYADEVWEVIQRGMDGNPRKTKRFINSFHLLQRILDDPNMNYFLSQDATPAGQTKTSLMLSSQRQDFYLAKMLVFQISFPEFYAHLQSHPDDWEYFEAKILQAEDSKPRELALRSRPWLETFWKDLRFITFMKATAPSTSLNYPVSPSKEVVTLLLQASSLVSET